MTMTTTLQQPQAESPSEFVPVAGGADTTSAELLLVVAYIGMWLLFFGFAVLTQRRQRGLDEKLSQLERAIEQAEATSGSSSA
jgi:hypothetical protein